MRAVILAGGLGTRLRPYTTVIPKPLVPVGGRPVLEHIIRSLHRDGVRKVDLCVSHLGNLIRLYLTQVGLPADLELEFHWEDEPLGTAGALRTVTSLDGPFIAMNGDILTTLDYAAFMRRHEESQAALTIAMHRKAVGIDLGVIESSDRLVTGYIEKPTLHYDVSMGIYAYDPRALEYVPHGPCQFPDLVMRLLEAGERVATFESDADWYDIGTLDEYELASRSFERAPEKFEVPSVREDPAWGPDRNGGPPVREGPRAIAHATPLRSQGTGPRDESRRKPAGLLRSTPSPAATRGRSTNG